MAFGPRRHFPCRPRYVKKAVSLLTLTFSTLIDANSRIKKPFH